MNNSDYWVHRITHERDVSAKNDELMEHFLTVTKGYFVWVKEPLIEKYHINHPFTYYYIDIRDESWPKGVKFGWYPLGIKKLFKENVLTFYFKFNGKRLEQGKEQLLSDLGFVFHDKTGTYRKAILVPKGENGDGTFFGLNEKEQKDFLTDTYKNYAEPIIKKSYYERKSWDNPRLKHHESLEFVENMTLKEKARAKVKELDARMAELNSLYENESDPEKQEEIAKEILTVVAQTNKFLRMAGADEQEMYAD